jgi:hypothetical protein
MRSVFYGYGLGEGVVVGGPRYPSPGSPVANGGNGVDVVVALGLPPPEPVVGVALGVAEGPSVAAPDVGVNVAGVGVVSGVAGSRTVPSVASIVIVGAKSF